ncbi:MAG: membrane dipeptidase [Candidatus Poribacteria bacterium]|jgi:membrane dipeptidase|nr:membrane dipeptidase [Candidatus Poribacteria bacterium]MDP6748536.1 membrane dipeptidase [Candidatus Poribacteria bacterium]MDP6998590.1 membrane dipeptidase [Candidatus Poribacteria bacterium]
MLIFDIHLDLAMNALSYNRDLRWSLERIRRWENAQYRGREDRVDRGNNTVCFPEMRRGGVGLCVATQIGRYAPYFHRLPGWNSPEQAWAQTQGQLAWYRIMEEAGELVSIRNRQQLDKHLEQWQNAPSWDDSAYVVESRTRPPEMPIGFVLSLEGADSIVTLQHLERSYNDGLRVLGPAHYGPGVYAHGTDADGPLPPKGKELLQEMQQLGIILDVTHLCDNCFWDALDCYDGPLWASHQNCRVLALWNRQFADDQIQAVIERGGILGMAFDAIMMVPNWVHKQSRPQDFQLRIERICDHIDHICQMAGNAKHVCIGTDLDGGYGTEQTPIDLDTIADLQSLPALLRARGYTSQDIEGIIWRNGVEFLRRAWKE